VTIKNGDNPGISASRLATPASVPVSEKGRKTGVSSSGAVESDQVSIDSHRTLVASVLGNGTVDNSNKVEELRRVYSAGQYNVDPVEVSRSIISSLLAGE